MRLLLTRCTVIATTVLNFPRHTENTDGIMETANKQLHPSNKPLNLANKQLNPDSEGDIVLVTGGAGFLGQHIISLLQTAADNVKEIRVLDLKEYRNKLGHENRKPVTSVVGSITDPHVVRKACQGVTSVYHIAGLISYGTFPDYGAMQRVNVQGTNNIITACEQENVSRLIYCSTVDVVIGHEEIIEGTEENTSPPEQYLFPGYPKSKYKAECLVLRANGTTSKDGTLHVENKRPMGHYAHQSSSIGGVLKTLSLRANVMYGEEDPHYVINGLRNAAKSGNTLIQVGDGTAKFQPVYVGNTAWAFLCADRALYNRPSVGGQYYFIPDDTPVQSTFQFLKPYLEVRGFKLSSFKLPFTLVYNMLVLAEMVVNFASPLVKITLPTESYSVKYINMNLYFKNTKAKEMLHFTPIFTPTEARHKSLEYYKNVKLN